MPLHLILFDVDGTLVDTSGAGRRAMERAYAAVFRIEGIAAKAAGVAFAGMTDPVILRAIAEAAGIDRDRFEAESSELRRVFVRELRLEMRRPEPRRRVLPGVLPLLERLDSRKDVRLGLLTGNLEAGARAKLEPFGLNRFFPAGGFSSDHPDRREIARIAWRRLSDLAGHEFPPGRVTVVGDTHHDVDCAKANGFRSVAVDSGWVPRSRLESAGPDFLLDDLVDPVRVLAALALGDERRS